MRRLQAVDFAVAVEGTGRADVDEISLMPDDAIGIFDPDEVAMAKAMHVTELRLGGNFSSYYHWRDGIGPADKRVTMENIAWGIPEYNKLGTDEFLAVLRSHRRGSAVRSEHGQRNAGGSRRLGALYSRRITRAA